MISKINAHIMYGNLQEASNLLNRYFNIIDDVNWEIKTELCNGFWRKKTFDCNAYKLIVIMHNGTVKSIAKS